MKIVFGARAIGVVIASLVIAASAVAAVVVPGDLDPNFGVNGYRTVSNGTGIEYSNIARSTNTGARYFAAGTTVVDGIKRPILTAFTSAGAIDTSFGTSGHVIDMGLPTDVFYTAVATASWTQGITSRHVVYQVATTPSAIYVYSFVEEAAGRTPASWGDGTRATIGFSGGGVWVYADITADSSGVVIAGTGKPLAGAPQNGVLAKLDRDTGAPLTTFGSGGRVYVSRGALTRFVGVVPARNGLCAVGRVFANAADANAWNVLIACFTSSGVLDPAFDGDGVVEFNFGDPGLPRSLGRSILWDAASSKLWIAANVCDSTGFCDLGAARFTSTGKFDNTFDGDGKNQIDVGASQSIGSTKLVKIGSRTYVAGYRSSADSSTADAYLFAFQGNGTGDPAFGTDGLRTYHHGSSASAFQAYAGITTNAGGNRLVASGSIDLTAMVAEHMP
jgi:hypothetical protein